MRKGISLLFIIIVGVFIFVPFEAMAKLRVVATLSGLGSIAQEVGGEKVEVDVLASAGEDPHFVEARPDFILRMSKADVLIYNGLEFEIGWLPKLQIGARNSKVEDGSKNAIDASLFIQAMEVPQGKVERSAGDIHPGGNPHYLYSIPNVIKVAEGLRDSLSNLDSENASVYSDNCAKFVSKMEKLSKEWLEKFEALDTSKRKFVSYHASMVYLASWLEMQEVASIEPKPGVSPNPSHVASVVGKMKKSEVKLILQERYQPKSTSDKIAEMVGAKVVVFNNGPDFKKDESYDAYMHKILKAIYEAIL